MLRKLFGRDPADLMHRAEKALAEGSVVRALELAEKAEARGGTTLDQARRLAERARNAAIDQAIAKADLAESAEDWEDAADWIEAALTRLRDPSRREELEQRLRILQARFEEARATEHLAGMLPKEEMVTAHTDDVYSALVEGLSPAWAARFDGRSQSFREAWVALNEGRAEDAVAVFEQLAEESPGDPVAHMERGRSRLLLGQLEGAQEDFETAWNALGDELLDRTGHLSAPGLWAEATLELGEPRKVVDRFEESVDTDLSHRELWTLYARSLLGAGELDSALSFLVRAQATQPGDSDLSYLLAQAHAEAGDPGAAIDTLEMAVAPTCSSGRCGAPSRHLPSIKMLVRLHLDHSGRVERARELMAWVLRDQGGMVSEDDQELLERLQEA